MKILKNHHNENSTYIIGKLIINGCQKFTIDKLDEVCKQYCVSHEHKESARAAYYANNENEDWESLAKHNDIIFRLAVAEQGYGLDVLVNDANWFVRLAVAEQMKKNKLG